MIEESLLIEFGAKKVSFDKCDFIFKEGSTARYFFQIVSGEVKMNNYNAEGREFIQGFFNPGDSFGEPPLLINDNYPANAVVTCAAVVYQLKKEKFLFLIKNHHKVHLNLTLCLAKRLYYKSIMVSEISTQTPNHRILKFIDYIKLKVNNIPTDTPYKVEITRQQIADLTGLRVETVIRSIKQLEKKGEIFIKDRKVFR